MLQSHRFSNNLTNPLTPNYNYHIVFEEVKEMTFDNEPTKIRLVCLRPAKDEEASVGEEGAEENKPEQKERVQNEPES